MPAVMNLCGVGGMWFSSRRGQTHYLARTGDFKGLVSEFLGIEGALNRGFDRNQYSYEREQFQWMILPMRFGSHESVDFRRVSFILRKSPLSLM